MKKIILLLFVSFLVFSCRSWTPMMMEYSNDSLDTKLPSLQLYAGTEYNTEIIGETEFRLFREEMERNIMTPYGDKYGSAFYSSRIIEEKEYAAWWIVSGLSLYTVNLLGVPLHQVKRVFEVEVRIVDLQGRLIGKYIGHGESKAVVALYYGYDLGSAYNKVMYESVNSALSDVRMQLRKDSSRLNKALLDSEKEFLETRE